MNIRNLMTVLKNGLEQFSHTTACFSSVNNTVVLKHKPYIRERYVLLLSAQISL